MRHKALYAWIAALLAAVALFTLDPMLDVRMSIWFYDGVARRFPGANAWWTKAVYDSIQVGSRIAAAWLLLCLVFPARRLFPFSRRAALFLLLALALGPGLIVHEGVKELWQRPRPDQTTLFGGEQIFAPWNEWSGQGGKSFVSGHAAAAFWVCALAFVVRRHQSRWMMGGLLLGALTGAARIAQGRHFLSDVVFAGIITFGVILLLAFILQVGKSGLPETAPQ